MPATASMSMQRRALGSSRAAAVGGDVVRTGTHADRVATQCVNALTPKWQTRLVRFNLYVWDRC
jgi:hypothetical protein